MNDEQSDPDNFDSQEETNASEKGFGKEITNERKKNNNILKKQDSKGKPEKYRDQEIGETKTGKRKRPSYSNSSRPKRPKPAKPTSATRGEKIDTTVDLILAERLPTHLKELSAETFQAIFASVNADYLTAKKEYLPTGAQWFEAVGAVVITDKEVDSTFQDLFAKALNKELTHKFAGKVFKKLKLLSYSKWNDANSQKYLQGFIAKKPATYNNVASKHVEYVFSGITSLLIIRCYMHRHDLNEDNFQSLTIDAIFEKLKEHKQIRVALEYFNTFRKCRHGSTTDLWEKLFQVKLRVTDFMTLPENSTHEYYTDVCESNVELDYNFSNVAKDGFTNDLKDNFCPLTFFQNAARREITNLNFYKGEMEKTEAICKEQDDVVSFAKRIGEAGCQAVRELKKLQFPLTIERANYENLLELVKIDPDVYTFADYMETLAKFHRENEGVNVIHSRAIEIKAMKNGKMVQDISSKLFDKLKTQLDGETNSGSDIINKEDSGSASSNDRSHIDQMQVVNDGITNVEAETSDDDPIVSCIKINSDNQEAVVVDDKQNSTHTTEVEIQKESFLNITKSTEDTVGEDDFPDTQGIISKEAEKSLKTLMTAKGSPVLEENGDDHVTPAGDFIGDVTGDGNNEFAYDRLFE